MVHKIGLLMLAWLLGSSVRAQEPLPDNSERSGSQDLTLADEFAFLEEDAAYVELAARHKQAIGMSPSAITVINREDIECSGATTIVDILRRVPGLESTIVTRNDLAASARVRWTWENNLFLVFIDGREANVELTGATLWEAQPIFVEDIERIEIIRGPGSALYGANAFVGVISITTRSIPKGTSVWAESMGGETGFAQVAARATTQIGQWDLSLSGGAARAGTFIDSRVLGRKSWKLRGLADYRWPSESHLRFESSYSYSYGPESTGMGMGVAGTDIALFGAAYETKNFQARLYWNLVVIDVDFDAPLIFKGIRLANISDQKPYLNTLDAQLQWTPPKFLEPILLITGANVRILNVTADEMLDRQTYIDPESPRYHQAGINYWEPRAAAYIHAEYTPMDWLVLTAGARLDYSAQFGFFVSPRLVSLFQAADSHFVRLSWGRAFRKPSFFEANAHSIVHFPPDSPIKGTSEQKFQEFMATSVLGNDQLEPERMDSFELGYWGSWFSERLILTANLYYSRFANEINVNPQIQYNAMGLPDLDTSSVLYVNLGKMEDIVGVELTLQWKISKSWLIFAGWSHKEVSGASAYSPKNMITLGGQYHSQQGFIGSLEVFTRSEFTDSMVDNPDGFLAGPLTKDLPNVALIQSKIGYRVSLGPDALIEAGIKLFLPVSPFSGPPFKYWEHGGVITTEGKVYGGDQLRRVLSAYLEGAF